MRNNKELFVIEKFLLDSSFSRGLIQSECYEPCNMQTLHTFDHRTLRELQIVI